MINEEQAVFKRQERLADQAMAQEPKSWTNLARAADNLKSAQEDVDRWNATADTVQSARRQALNRLGEAQNKLEKIALSETANHPE